MRVLVLGGGPVGATAAMQAGELGADVTLEASSRLVPHADEDISVALADAIWVALWGGGAVRRYRPDGALLTAVPLPVDRPTSCAFGGPDMSTLFVTTARHGLDDAALSRQPDAGRVFRIEGLGVRGAPCAPYRGRTSPS